MTNLEVAVSTATRIVSEIRIEISQEASEGLYNSYESAKSRLGAQQIGVLYSYLKSGFFHCAEKGVQFVPIEIVHNEYQINFEGNRDALSEPFVNFANSYWSLKYIVDSIYFEAPNALVSQLLLKLEQEIGSVFFPTVGPVKLPKSLRKKMMRDMIIESGASINVDYFIRSYPLFQQQVSGCLLPVISMMLLLFILAITV